MLGKKKHFSQCFLAISLQISLLSLYRICLLPDERSQRRCSPSSDTFADLNPVFNENFVFQVRSSCENPILLHSAVVPKRKYP